MASLYSDPNVSEHKNQLRENIIDAAFEEFVIELVPEFSTKNHPLATIGFYRSYAKK